MKTEAEVRAQLAECRKSIAELERMLLAAKSAETALLFVLTPPDTPPPQPLRSPEDITEEMNKRLREPPYNIPASIESDNTD